MAIEFDEALHEYRVDGRKLPGVTSILKPLYGDLRFVREDILAYKSELGQAVHKAVELHVKGGLVYDSLVSPVAEYFEQYLIFEAETGFEPTESEIRVSSALGYAGTLDLSGRLNGELGICDLKCTAALSPAVALQTAAYQHAYNERAAERAVRRWALRLYPGGYRLQPYRDDAVDFAAFLGLLKIKQWCDAKGATLGAMTNE